MNQARSTTGRRPRPYLYLVFILPIEKSNDAVTLLIGMELEAVNNGGLRDECCREMT
jgi:hypothetical protein